MDMKRIRARIDAMTEELIHQQSQDGAWRMCFDSGTMTDSYLIILLRLLGRADERLIHMLAARIASKQEENGAWKVYPDESEGNLDATSEAYFALLYAGYYYEADPRMVRAKQFILKRGGLSEVRSLLTQVMFAATGQAEWPRMLRIPLEAFSPISESALIYSPSLVTRVSTLYRLSLWRTNNLYAKRAQCPSFISYLLTTRANFRMIRPGYLR